MKTNRRVALLFISALSSFALLLVVLFHSNALKVVYGESMNSPLAAGLDLTSGASAAAYPGEIVTYTHTLTNTGDATDVFTVTLSSSQGWAVTPQTNPFTQTLDAGEKSFITVTVNVPVDAAENDQDELEVMAQSTNDPLQTATAVNTTTVRYYKIFLPAVTNPARWEKAGDNWPSNVVGRSLAVCATDPNIIVAGTIDNGVQIFNGTSWAAAASVPTGYSVTSLVMNQACDRAYAGLYNDGVWQGQRNGAIWSWTQMGGSEVLLIRSLALAGERLFAGGDFGIRYWDSNSWQTTNGIIGNQPVMYISAANAQDSNSALYAVQWQYNKVYRAVANSPGIWTPLSQIVPNSEMRAVFGDASEARFVGTQSGSYQLNGNTWQALSVSAGLRAGVVTGATAYLGYTNNAGVYKVQGNTLTSMNAGWNTPPEFVYDLVLANGKLYAATTTDVWVYAQP